MRQRHALILLFVVLSTFLITGCKSQESSNKKTIEVFSSKPENQLVFKEFIKEFESENPDVKVVFSSPPDAGTVLRTRLVKDDIPSVIAYGGDITYTELANVGMLEDLSTSGLADELVPAYKEMTQALQKDQSKLYGIPYAANASGVIYNVDLFKEHQQEVPKTWDEFLAVSHYFKEHGITPIEGTFKDSWTLMSIFNPLAGILTEPDFMRERQEDKTTFIKGWQQPMKQLTDIMTLTQKDAMGTSYADGTQAFAKGESAMIINGTWAIPEVKKTNESINIDIFPLPASNNQSKNVVTSGVDVMFMVGKDTNHQEESKRFIKFMMDKERATRYINDQFAFSAIKGVSQNAETLNGISPIIEEGRVTDFIDHFVPNGYDLPSLLSEFALKQTSHPDETVKNIDDSLKTMDKSYDTANFE
ncbi:hypothetical protein CBF34_04730 [Vagococcus penaei]|uniref:ABC transporter substrate-binding protein n=1 Tax=Vagococcus penaei TaxID=633807 RepID=UPI000F86531B|nr:extracellular solute-binding protein [Vagococcus penaei]RSU04100.1 hypothetical protein CBF34_04730 [Vagococcus penaei]